MFTPIENTVGKIPTKKVGRVSTYQSKATTIDPKFVEELSMMQCTMQEMSRLCRCGEDLLHSNFRDIIEYGREHGRMSLKRAQYKKAMEGSVPMLIWLGKVWLKQKDDEVSMTHQAEVTEIMNQLKSAFDISSKRVESNSKAEDKRYE